VATVLTLKRQDTGSNIGLVLRVQLVCYRINFPADTRLYTVMGRCLQSLERFASVLAGGFGELNGHADDGDSPQSVYAAVGSHSADHAEAVRPRLYSGCTASTRMIYRAAQGPTILPPFIALTFILH